MAPWSGSSHEIARWAASEVLDEQSEQGLGTMMNWWLITYRIVETQMA